MEAMWRKKIKLQISIYFRSLIKLQFAVYALIMCLCQAVSNQTYLTNLFSALRTYWRFKSTGVCVCLSAFRRQENLQFKFNKWNGWETWPDVRGTRASCTTVTHEMAGLHFSSEFSTRILHICWTFGRAPVQIMAAANEHRMAHEGATYIYK